MTCYCFVASPLNWGAYVCAMFLAGSASSMIVVMQSYVAKRTPKNIRGMIFAMIGVVCAIGSILYLQIYGILYETFPNQPWLSFGVISLFDCLVLVFLLIMIWMGKFGEAPPGTDDDIDDRGADTGAGGYDDIPKLDEAEQNALEKKPKPSLKNAVAKAVLDNLANV